MINNSIEDIILPIFRISENIIMRPPVPFSSDAQGYFDCYNDPGVGMYMPENCVPSDLEEANKDLQYLENTLKNRKGGAWAIVDERYNYVIGMIGFFSWDFYHSRAEISYELNSDYWRLGIISAALKYMTFYLFETLNINRLQATTVVQNMPSVNLLLKCNFSKEGVLSKYKFYRGEYVDIIMFGYSKEKYLNNLRISDMISEGNTSHYNLEDVADGYSNPDVGHYNYLINRQY